ncbi:MAG TPA: hypothetical protein VFK07_01545, partial [Candidatus Paceibacterota bacterium]|nr:hypothetical protein [Candidatus Paceibacterota bacterium]
KISALQSDQTVFLQFTDANGKVVSMAIDANHLPAYSFAAQTSDESNIRFLIDSFGAKLKNVSLLSPTAKADIDKNYKDYVAPQLLAEWEANPEKAMGRLTSSPWPDGIMIATITNTGNNTYRISAKLLEVTSTEVTTNSALMEPITIEVQKIDGSWKIISAQRD